MANTVEVKDKSVNNYADNNTCSSNDSNKFLLRRTSDEACVATVSSDNVVENDKGRCDTVNAATISADTVTQTVTGNVTTVTAAKLLSTVSSVTSVVATSTAVDTETVSVLPVVAEERLLSTVTVNSLSPVCRASTGQPHVSLNTEPYPVKVICLSFILI